MKHDIKYLHPSEIIPYANNPRKNDDAIDKVAQSIKEFGFQNPIIVDKNMVIIAGHTRWKAALKLNLDKVPVIVADLSPEKAKAYRIADNRTSDFSFWDWEKLEQELNEIDNEMVELIGFDLGEVENIDVVNNVESDEWVGMPEFEPEESDIAIVIHFDSKEEREKFVKETKIYVYSRGDAQKWIAYYNKKEKGFRRTVKLAWDVDNESDS